MIPSDQISHELLLTFGWFNFISGDIYLGVPKAQLLMIWNYFEFYVCINWQQPKSQILKYF